MNPPATQSRGFLWLMKGLLISGVLLTVLGLLAELLIHSQAQSLDEAYKRDRASQYRVNVTSSRNLHPTNQYLPWGPQTVTSGYDGPDRKHIYEDQKRMYRIFIPVARKAIMAGIFLVLMSIIFSFRKRPQGHL